MQGIRNLIERGDGKVVPPIEVITNGPIIERESGLRTGIIFKFVLSENPLFVFLGEAKICTSVL